MLHVNIMKFLLLSMQDVADRATVTRLTVSKVEHGDPTVSMVISWS